MCTLQHTYSEASGIPSHPIAVTEYLRNPVYAALTTAEKAFAQTNGVSVRFHPDVIPFGAVPQPTAEAFADLVPLLEPGEEIYVTLDDGLALEPAKGLVAVSTLPGLQMRYAGRTPVDEDGSRVLALGAEDVPEMLDLKARAFPGYFGPRAPELGRFYGIRDEASGGLVAMGGERLATETDREISAVCTHPDHVGRGYAARLIRAILRHQAALGVRSILHVTAANSRAIGLYQHLGFEITGSLGFVKLRRE